MRAVALGLALLFAMPADSRGALEWTNRVGADFEHFGEVYRITADQDTVTAINDWGTVLGFRARTPFRDPSRLSMSGSVHVGQETRRFRFDFDGRLERGANRFELSQEASYRSFRDGGEYSISSDHFDERLELGWERRLSEVTSLRLRQRLEGTWHSTPDEYNLDEWTLEPRADLRFRFREFDEALVGFRYANRAVPDSATLGYDRGIFELGTSVLFGWTSSFDFSNQLERRVYDDASVRESYWENRFDTRLEFGLTESVSMRLVHENQFTRYDRPDELDFDANWARTGVQLEIHQSARMDVGVMPVYAFLTSSTAAQEEYSEAGLEIGFDLRIGSHTWISVTDEVGRRDYEVTAQPVTDSGLGAADPTDVLEAGFDTAYSDYVYNRLTVLISSDLPQGFSVNLFVNWQPENHQVNSHDTDTRIVSGGVDYRF